MKSPAGTVNIAGGEEIDLLVGVGEAGGVDDGWRDVVAPADERVEGGSVDGGAGVGRGIVVVAGRTDVVDLFVHVADHEEVFVCEVLVYSVEGVVLTVELRVGVDVVGEVCVVVLRQIGKRHESCWPD